MNPNKYFSSARFRYGGVSVAITAVFLAVIIVVNIIAGMLSDKFPMTVDLTRNSLFEMSQQSIDFVKSVKQPVAITVLMNEKQLETGGGYFTQIKTVIDLYAKHNRSITVDYVDLVVNPAFAAGYPELDLSYNDVLVSSGNKSEIISMNDMFNTQYDQYSGKTYITSSKAEQELTSAIMRVTSDSMVRISVLSGHGEINSEFFIELLDKNGYDVVQQNLLTEEIDPLADFAVMLGTARDPDVEVLKKLTSFLENDGRYGKSLLYAPTPTAVSTPNLDAFLAQWGIRVDSGLVVETDSKRIVNNTPYLCVVDYTSKDYTDTLTTDTMVLSPIGRELSTLFEYRSGYTADILLSYSPSSCIMPVDATQNWVPSKELLGARPALIRSSFTKYDNTIPQSSRVFVVSSLAALEAVSLQSRSVANAEYYISMFNTVTERTDVISVAPKDIAGTELGINQFQFLAIGALVVILLPLTVLIAGIVVWLRRRNR